MGDKVAVDKDGKVIGTVDEQGAQHATGEGFFGEGAKPDGRLVDRRDRKVPPVDQKKQEWVQAHETDDESEKE